ncbi:MAG: hypothetical protein CVV22_05750 [Ignavibacteriae bacterium HGW-Ignavibacteriae-1]|jgi:MFS family permease|nr:MAG: hypothetical protein CVV22_05750 [Ignavibacteriae bacterium HGW-Ignavibacteriae-1]
MQNIFTQIRSFSKEFWLLNLIQMIERLAYSALVLQMAVYISQKDIVGGLHWEHTTKGMIFFVWALVQNLIPVLTGGLADKFGRKNMIFISIFFAIIGFYLFAFQREFTGVMTAAVFVGIGLGSFKPALQGLISNSMRDKFTSIGWGLNIMLINVAFFFAPALSKYLEEISWQIFFIVTGSILIIIIPLLFLIKDDNDKIKNEPSITIKEILIGVLRPQILSFVIIMGGFAIIYMQFYETLPNFIYDWVDTSQVAKALNLPDYMLMTTSLGTMIDFKWLYTLNSSFIVLGVVTVSWLMSGVKLRYAIMFGITTASLGLFVSGATQIGSMAVLGMLIYTLGEMITNPRYLEYMASLGTKSRRSVYLGYLNISFAIGLAGGSLLGGFLYNEYSEKSTLAIRYLEAQQVDMTQITHSNAMDKVVQFTNTSIQESTSMLWDLYSPNKIWYIFLGIGIFSTLLIYLHSRIYHNQPLK